MKNLSIIAVIIIVIIFGYFLFNKNSQQDNDAVVETPTEIESETGEETSEIAPDDSPVSVGSYEAYSLEKLAQYSDKKTVLFFKADWCPSCRSLDRDIKDSLSEIPGDLVILEVDYDNSTDLKKKYGVTTQHTLVFVDADGEMLDKWSGGNSLEDIVDKLN